MYFDSMYVARSARYADGARSAQWDSFMGSLAGGARRRDARQIELGTETRSQQARAKQKVRLAVER